MNGKRFSEKKSRKNGFYLALAVCLVAVGIAAWSTYDAVSTYTAPRGTTQSSQAEAESKIEKSTPTPKPIKQTAGTVESKAETREEFKEPKEEVSSAVSEPPAESADAEIYTEPQVPVTAPLYEISEEIMSPLESEGIAKAYSAGAPIYSETMKDWRVHKGADFTAKPGETVYACANGQVKRTYTDSMLGNVMIIEHGDYEFYYCGLGENFLAAEGDIVTKGQVIGNVTAVPEESADEIHLHLEVKRDGVYLDPESVISGKE